MKYQLILINDECEQVVHAFPGKYVVCECCHGHGVQVMESLREPSAELMEDEDFREAYFEGRYDEPCGRCSGKRVELVLDDSDLTPEQAVVLGLWQEQQHQARIDARYAAAERAMGA